MAGKPLGAASPVSLSFNATEPRQRIRLVASALQTRTRRNHGALTLGGQLACVYSMRSAQQYSVRVELGTDSLTLASSMTPGQARALAKALNAAANAVDATDPQRRA